MNFKKKYRNVVDRGIERWRDKYVPVEVLLAGLALDVLLSLVGGVLSDLLGPPGVLFILFIPPRDVLLFSILIF